MYKSSNSSNLRSALLILSISIFMSSKDVLSENSVDLRGCSGRAYSVGQDFTSGSGRFKFLGSSYKNDIKSNAHVITSTHYPANVAKPKSTLTIKCEYGNGKVIVKVGASLSDGKLVVRVKNAVCNYFPVAYKCQ